MVAEVEYFDDSKGTNVGATLAALQGLGAQKRLVVIMGGQGKGQDFGPLAPAVARYARAVVLIGADAAALRAALASSQVPLLDAQSMQDAVAQAAALAQPGDAVLMSPACASLDMFRDYSHRAQVFTDAVAALAADAGTVLEAFA
jgi:UDP-N-acetylmuramoylalanine--D-glutamate ligase